MTKSSEPRSLHFLGIGAPRCGTTSLFHYLRHHPLIYMPPTKEMPFFSDADRFAAGWPAFWHRYLQNAPADKLIGKITPQYMGDRRVAERISALMPDVRLIAILRSRIDRTFSDWRLRRQTNKESRSFAQAIAEQMEPAQLKKAREYRYGDEQAHDLFLARSEYGRILRWYYDCFPARQVLILFTEELASQPQVVMDSIMGFLGLEETYRPKNLGEQYHQSGERLRFRRLPQVLARKAMFRRLWHLLPERAKTDFWWWFKDKFGSVRGQAPEMGRETRTLLEDFYRRDVAELERLIDRRVPWPKFSVSGKPSQT